MGSLGRPLTTATEGHHINPLSGIQRRRASGRLRSRCSTQHKGRRTAERRRLFVNSVEGLNQVAQKGRVGTLAGRPVHAIHGPEEGGHRTVGTATHKHGDILVWVVGLRLKKVSLHRSDLPADASMTTIRLLRVKVVANQEHPIGQIKLGAHPLGHIGPGVRCQTSSRASIPFFRKCVATAFTQAAWSAPNHRIRASDDRRIGRHTKNGRRNSKAV